MTLPIFQIAPQLPVGAVSPRVDEPVHRQSDRVMRTAGDRLERHRFQSDHQFYGDTRLFAGVLFVWLALTEFRRRRIVSRLTVIGAAARVDRSVFGCECCVLVAARDRDDRASVRQFDAMRRADRVLFRAAETELARRRLSPRVHHECEATNRRHTTATNARTRKQSN